jgi:hypothetical protein
MLATAHTAPAALTGGSGLIEWADVAGQGVASTVPQASGSRGRGRRASLPPSASGRGRRSRGTISDSGATTNPLVTAHGSVEGQEMWQGGLFSATSPIKRGALLASDDTGMPSVPPVPGVAVSGNVYMGYHA